MKSSLKNMVLVLFTITALSSLLVGLVNYITQDTIAQAETKTKNEAKFKVLGTSEKEAMIVADSIYTISDFEVVASIVANKNNKEIIGYAVEAPSITKNGYGGRIKLMVGFMPNEAKDGVTISGIEVLAQNETPGLGANMKNPGNNLEKSALNNDPSTMTFKVKKEGGSFDALTGSTISSRAYANAMETAYAGYLKATGQLEDIKIEDTTSGATDTASGATTDAASGATNNK